MRKYEQGEEITADRQRYWERLLERRSTGVEDARGKTKVLYVTSVMARSVKNGWRTSADHVSLFFSVNSLPSQMFKCASKK